MATDRQRGLVWNGIYDAERLHRYYGYLSERLDRRDTILVWSSLVLSSGAFGVLITRAPNWIAIIASVAIAAISLTMVITRYSRKSVYCAELCNAFANLKIEWEQLWNRMDSLDPHHAQQEYSRLQSRAVALTERAPVELHISKGLLKRSDDEATEYLAATA